MSDIKHECFRHTFWQFRLISQSCVTYVLVHAKSLIEIFELIHTNVRHSALKVKKIEEIFNEIFIRYIRCYVTAFSSKGSVMGNSIEND